MSEERVERLLAEVHDDFGMIRVLEVADYRFLEFGDAIEQSCVFTADPSWLEYDYSRAMLLAALVSRNSMIGTDRDLSAARNAR